MKRHRKTRTISLPAKTASLLLWSTILYVLLAPLSFPGFVLCLNADGRFTLEAEAVPHHSHSGDLSNLLQNQDTQADAHLHRNPYFHLSLDNQELSARIPQPGFEPAAGLPVSAVQFAGRNHSSLLPDEFSDRTEIPLPILASIRSVVIIA